MLAAAVAAAALLIADLEPAAARSFWSFGNSHSISGGYGFFPFGRYRRHSGSKRHHRDASRDRGKNTQEEQASSQAPYHVVISLNDQRLTLYDRTGAAIARSPVSTGVPGHPTPTGVFSVIQKRRWHSSNIYSGAPMPYMQRITWSGIALHAGDLPGGPASHGCIRLPAHFAKKLWTTTKVGARVIIVQDRLAAPAAFSHPQLAALKPEPVEERAPPPEAGGANAVDLSVAPAAGDVSPPAPTPAPQPATAVAAADAGHATDVAPAGAERKHARGKRKTAKLRPGPISVFVSGKTGKVYVRKGFAPVLSAPVTIERAGEPLGTHVFTAVGFDDDGTTLKFNAVTMPGEMPAAAAALDRISLPPEVVERIAKLMTPGASIIVSDKGLGHETGAGTDFIVLTH